MSCSNTLGCTVCTESCPDLFGCNSDVDFCVKRFDSKPPFKIELNDCDGPFDLTDLVAEVNMWANAKLKTAILSTDTQFALVDNIGFEQILIGDVIWMDRVRSPEQMLVTGFDEINSLVFVQRGYNGTTASDWKKGTKLKIFRFFNAAAQTEMILEDITQIDGTILQDQLIQSFLVYDWGPQDTATPGCYYLEFKLIKMDGCAIEWIRRFPSEKAGFVIRILNTPTAEMTVCVSNQTTWNTL